MNMTLVNDYTRIAVLGNVDAGKSTLIGRFLYEMDTVKSSAMREITEESQRLGRGIDFAHLLDSFEEERVGEKTIDTTQAFCKNKKGLFIFIDVPGHDELIKNLLTGSSCADSVILVVDVRTGLDEQTKKHIAILNMLGLHNFVVAINKMDYVDFNILDFRRTKNQLTNYINKLKCHIPVFIPISAINGDNLINISGKMRWYNGLTLLSVLNRFNNWIKENLFRFSVQGVYGSDKHTIIAGRVLTGRIKKNDAVYVLPEKKAYSIKSIRVFNKSKKTAYAGESIGLILKGNIRLGRGNVICKSPFPKTGKLLRVKIFSLSKIEKHRTFIFNSLCQESKAWVSKIIKNDYTAEDSKCYCADYLVRNEIGEVEIILKNDIVYEKFSCHNQLGRFILKDNLGIVSAFGIIL
ncbi:MAG: GTP-binding protein [Candidatus Omnitrophota bacterium]|nr:GTP-binding protein [Candidatus Omnitrophota bacterium]